MSPHTREVKMEASNAFVGVDVSKKKIDIALQLNGKMKTKVLDNTADGHTALLAWLSKHKAPFDRLHVCMEATGVYHERLAWALHDAGLKVSVVNPGCIKRFGQSENLRNKNDTVDAALIARYCSAMAPATWEPPSI